MTDERRSQRRVPALIDVVWAGSAGKREARTSDLSTGGCFVDTVGQTEVGEVLDLRLKLPGGEWIDVEGEVTYAYPNIGFGVRFTRVAEADQKKIEWLVKAEAYRQDGKRE
jgi:hypothetical protein